MSAPNFASTASLQQSQLSEPPLLQKPCVPALFSAPFHAASHQQAHYSDVLRCLQTSQIQQQQPLASLPTLSMLSTASNDSTTHFNPLLSFSAYGASALKHGQGASCHQCKTSKHVDQLMICGNRSEKMRRRSCVKKYCSTCLMRAYGIQMSNMSPSERVAWMCPSCSHSCCCAACKRGKKSTGNRQQARRPSSASTPVSNSSAARTNLSIVPSAALLPDPRAARPTLPAEPDLLQPIRQLPMLSVKTEGSLSVTPFPPTPAAREMADESDPNPGLHINSAPSPLINRVAPPPGSKEHEAHQLRTSLQLLQALARPSNLHPIHPPIAHGAGSEATLGNALLQRIAQLHSGIEPQAEALLIALALNHVQGASHSLAAQPHVVSTHTQSLTHPYSHTHSHLQQPQHQPLMQAASHPQHHVPLQLQPQLLSQLPSTLFAPQHQALRQHHHHHPHQQQADYAPGASSHRSSSALLRSTLPLPHQLTLPPSQAPPTPNHKSSPDEFDYHTLAKKLMAAAALATHLVASHPHSAISAISSPSNSQRQLPSSHHDHPSLHQQHTQQQSRIRAQTPLQPDHMMNVNQLNLHSHSHPHHQHQPEAMEDVTRQMIQHEFLARCELWKM